MGVRVSSMVQVCKGENKCVGLVCFSHLFMGVAGYLFNNAKMFNYVRFCCICLCFRMFV